MTATLKPMRSGETVTISDLTLDSTIHDVKTQYAQKSGQAQDKIKLLLNKKPAADLKTLKDLGVDSENVELSVMIMGGGTTPGTSQVSSPVVEKSEAAAAVGMASTGDKMDVDKELSAAAPVSEKAGSKPSAEEVLKDAAFWTDLKGFLWQRLQDEAEDEKVLKAFQDAWSKR